LNFSVFIGEGLNLSILETGEIAGASLLENVSQEGPKALLFMLFSFLVLRNWLVLFVDWPDDSVRLWFAESVASWRHHLGIASDWLSQGLISLHLDLLDRPLTSIILISWILHVPFLSVSVRLLCLSQGFSSLSVLSRLEWLCIPFLIILTLSYYPGQCSCLSTCFSFVIQSTVYFFIRGEVCGCANKYFDKNNIHYISAFSM